MNDKRKKKYIKTAVLLFIVISGLYVCVKYFQATSPLFNFFFSPDDLYKPLVCTEVDLSKIGEYKLDFQNKYPGDHRVVVMVEKPTKVSRSYQTDFKLNIEIIERDKVIIFQETTKPISPFWGTRGSGFAIFTYNVPSDLKRREPLTVTVRVEIPDERFTVAYGKQKLCVQKFSDE